MQVGSFFCRLSIKRWSLLLSTAATLLLLPPCVYPIAALPMTILASVLSFLSSPRKPHTARDATTADAAIATAPTGSSRTQRFARTLSLVGGALCGLLVSTTAMAAEDQVITPDADKNLFVYNWSDYIDPQVLKDFEQETGITVHYDIMDSNEVLEAKLMVGSSGYDIIAPSIHVLKRLGDAGLLLPLDKSKLPNLKHLDPQKMAKIALIDKDNRYGIPYMELSTGIAYNTRKVAEIMGSDFKVDSWSILFDENVLKKLSQCGITALDSPSDMLCSTLIYMGRDPESTKAQDYEDAGEMLKILGRYVRYFHSSQYANDLASGDVCIGVAWAGDAQLANQRSLEAGLDPIAYVIPKEGALMGYDMLAITKTSKHPNNAHIFLNYIMRPEVIAKISDYIRYANANKDATALMDPEITSNKGIYYDEQTLQRMHIVVPPTEVERIMTRTWNNVISASAQ